MRQTLQSPKPVTAQSAQPKTGHASPVHQAGVPAKSLAFSMATIPAIAPILTGTVIQQKSHVANNGQGFSWNGKTTTVGKTMLAFLDPKDPLKGESASANSSQSEMMDAIRDKYALKGNQLVKGHLLNDNLGGKAYGNNLYPITGSTNKTHLGFAENAIKNLVWGDGKKKTVPTPTWYQVVIDGGDTSKANIDEAKHSLDISWGDYDGVKMVTGSPEAKISISTDFGSKKESEVYDVINDEDVGYNERIKANLTSASAYKSGYAHEPYKSAAHRKKDIEHEINTESEN